MFALSRKRYAGSIMPNPLHRFEAGMAVENMALQATAEGLVFHQMLGFWSWPARRTFRIPGSHAVLTAIAVGYPGAIDNLPERQRRHETGERKRKPASEFAFVNRAFAKA
jgi:nitroreductase